LPNPRVGAAVDAALGYIGFKSRDSTRAFERQGKPAWDSLRTKVVTELTLTAADTQRLGGAFKFSFARLRIAGGVGTSGAVSYKRVVVEIDDLLQARNALNKMIESDPGLRSDLRDGETRLVDGVDMVYGYKASGGAVDSANVSASLAKDSLVFNAGTSRRWTLALSDGTVLSYRLVKLCWNAEGRIARMVQDRPGQGNECPNGTTESPRGP
jgi:hypothetical protein